MFFCRVDKAQHHTKPCKRLKVFVNEIARRNRRQQHQRQLLLPAQNVFVSEFFSKNNKIDRGSMSLSSFIWRRMFGRWRSEAMLADDDDDVKKLVSLIQRQSRETKKERSKTLKSATRPKIWHKKVIKMYLIQRWSIYELSVDKIPIKPSKSSRKSISPKQIFVRWNDSVCGNHIQCQNLDCDRHGVAKTFSEIQFIPIKHRGLN